MAGILATSLILQLTLLGFAFYGARTYVARSADRAVEATAGVLAAKLDAYFSTSVVAARLVSLAIEHGQVGSETDELANVLYRPLLLVPQLVGLHVVRPDGESVDVTRTGDGFTLRTISGGEGASERTETRDSRFEMLSFTQGTPETDPRETHEYVDAATTLTAQWADAHVVDSGAGSHLAFSQPVLDASGQLVAVVWVEVNLDAMAVELTNAPVGVSGTALLVDSGQLVVVAPEKFASQVAAHKSATGTEMSVSDLGLRAADAVPPLVSTAPDAVAPSSQRAVDGWVVREERLLIEDGPDLRLYVAARPAEAVPGGFDLVVLIRVLAITLAVAMLVPAAVAFLVRGRMSAMSTNATRDHLTGVANRDEVIRLVPRNFALSREAGDATCVAMLDVDNFKALNDMHGHSAGDRALVMIVQSLQEVMRGEDVCGRWGGDEFVLVLSVRHGASAFWAVDRLRRSAEVALREKYPGVGLGITAGFAVAETGVRDFDVLMRAADEALVAGKREGKSRAYAAAVPLPDAERDGGDAPVAPSTRW